MKTLSWCGVACLILFRCPSVGVAGPGTLFQYSADTQAGSPIMMRDSASGNLNAYPFINILMNRCTFDASEKHEGMASVKYSIDKPHTGNWGGLGPEEFPEAPYAINMFGGGWFYSRAWVKFKQSGTDKWDWGSGFREMKTTRAKVVGGATAGTWELYHNHLLWAHDDGSGLQDVTIANYDFDPATNPILYNWTEIIVAIKTQSGPGKADGESKLFINGQEVVRHTARNWFGTYWTSSQKIWMAWGGFMGNPYPQLNAVGQTDPVAGGVFWVDDLETSTTFSSTVSSTTTPIPLKAPTRLRVL